MTQKNRKTFWNFINNSLGNVINLPVRANLKTKRASKINREECTEDLFADTTIDMTDEYCKQQKKKRFLEFCQCENDCTIYVGKTRVFPFAGSHDLGLVLAATVNIMVNMIVSIFLFM